MIAATAPVWLSANGEISSQPNQLEDKIHAARWKRGGGNSIMMVSGSF
jgi:hypothetical protein